MAKLVLLKNKGCDGNKKVAGRKRHIVVDTLGYSNIDVHRAIPHDGSGGKRC